MVERKRILFVDDEASILAGLEKSLHRERPRWELVFATGGKAGLAEIRKAPFDVVVSDMRMPGMDGAMLLQLTQDACPTAVRILLSGYADRAALIRALPSIHQFLVKPCETAVLRRTIERSLQGAEVDRDGRLQRIIGQVDKLPSPSDIYFELSRLIRSPTCRLGELHKVVSRDPALAAKLLQLANTAHFRLGKATTSIDRAVEILGLERLRYVALTTSVFTPSEGADYDEAVVSALQRVALETAQLAAVIAPPALRDEAFAAGLLHELGTLVLAIGFRHDLELARARIAQGESAPAVELERFGVTQTAIAARLLSMWGLPDDIVDAVQFHRDPGAAPEPARVLASLVHVAAAVVTAHRAPPVLDMASLERAGVGSLVAGWSAAAIAANLDAPSG